MLQEDRATLTQETQDMKRALDSLEEELQAVDYYRQRADASTDEDLKNIFLHNMEEEEEHAAKLIAWVAGVDDVMAKNLKKFLGRKQEDIAHD